MKCLLASLVVFVFSASLWAEPDGGVDIKTGFITGNDFRSMSTDVQRGYAMGYVDGVFVAPLFHAPKIEMLYLEQCLIDMRDSQIVAIINKFLADNPARWHESMNGLSYSAFWHECKN